MGALDYIPTDGMMLCPRCGLPLVVCGDQQCQNCARTIGMSLLMTPIILYDPDPLNLSPVQTVAGREDKMPKYTNYTEEQIVKALEACGFKRVLVARTQETVMEREVEDHPDRRIRVYTSAVKGQGARDVGKDAARVVVMERSGFNYMGDERWDMRWTARRVHRTEKFLENLKERCRLAWKVATSKCPECGAIMCPRRKKGERKDTFWGCRRFPMCRATVDM